MRPGLERVSELLGAPRPATGRRSGRPRRRHQRQVVDDAVLRGAAARPRSALGRVPLAAHLRLDGARARRRASGGGAVFARRRRARARRGASGCLPGSARRRSSRCSPSPHCSRSRRAGSRPWPLEAGLGGRLDATNVVEAPVVVLTNIALNTPEVLGDTRELIFAEKAAVIKGGDAVFGELDGLEDEARRVCSAAGATPHFLRDAGSAGRPAVAGSPDDFAVTFAPAAGQDGALGRPARAHAGPVPGQERRARGRRGAPAPRRPRRGRRPAGAGRPPPCPAACRSSASGRSCSPTAPTTRTACACSHRASPPSTCPRPAVGVLAIMRDKDYPAMIAGFLPLLDRVVCTQASEPRSLTAGELAAAVGAAAAPGGAAAAAEVEVVADPHAALARARDARGARRQRPRRRLALPARGPARRAGGGLLSLLARLEVRIYWRKSVER